MKRAHQWQRLNFNLVRLDDDWNVVARVSMRNLDYVPSVLGVEQVPPRFLICSAKAACDRELSVLGYQLEDG